MTKKILIGSIVALAGLIPVSLAAQAQQEQTGKTTTLSHAIMHPDAATLRQWQQEAMNAPKARIDSKIMERQLSATAPVRLDRTLLDHIPYVPSERDQKSCGNCWVWASTALTEVKHSVENLVKDRLSIQYFDSAEYDGNPNDFACQGGTLDKYIKFYNAHVFVPWSNKNGQFQDQSGNAPPIAASKISTHPDYNGQVNSLVSATVVTTTVSNGQAIDNIKNQLLQNKAVEYSFWMPNQADWNAFDSFWNNKTENDLWDPDPYCGDKNIDKGKGGHAVTIVDYDTSDPDMSKHYWVVLNSWGANSGRPNGLFHLKMHMNYTCTDAYAGSDRLFQTLETVSSKTPFNNTNALFMAQDEASTNELWFREHGISAPWSIWSLQGGWSDRPPALATFNTRLYMVNKSDSDGSLWLSDFYYPSGDWTSSTEIKGVTADKDPALVVYRGRLYLFVKTSGASTIQFASMDTSGNWSTWQTVPGAATAHSPSVVVFDDQVRVFITSQTDGLIYLNSMNSAGAWTGWVGWSSSSSKMVSDAAPAAAVFGDAVNVVVKGKSGSVYNDNLYMATSSSPQSFYTLWSQLPGATTGDAPMIAVGPDVNTLTVTIGGKTNNTLYELTYTGGSGGAGWAKSWTKIPGGYSAHPPSMGAYWYPFEGPGPEFVQRADAKSAQ